MSKKRVLKKYDGKKLEWLKAGKHFAVLLIVLFIIFRFVIGISWVSGESMQPTLNNGNPVFYLRVFNEYKKGDIISVKMPSGEYLIKRIVAEAGDTVDIHDGKLFVNGIPESEPYGANTEPQLGGPEYPLTVGADQIFAVGDNRVVSIDSRTFGALATSQIRGKILFYWRH